MFAEEKPFLQPLPLEPFRYYQYGKRTVHIDGCVEVEAAYYGAPPGWIGRQVDVQWDAMYVRLLETGERELTIMRWGLIPFWSKDAKIAYSTINAKAETIAMSPAYREPLKRRRCLVPADLFWEWKKFDAKTRQPYAIALQNESLFAFAGLWDTWKDKAQGQSIDTYTIITTDPNELMESLHNRMPVILHKRDYERWLVPAERKRVFQAVW